MLDELGLREALLAAFEAQDDARLADCGADILPEALAAPPDEQLESWSLEPLMPALRRVTLWDDPETAEAHGQVAEAEAAVSRAIAVDRLLAAVTALREQALADAASSLEGLPAPAGRDARLDGAGTHDSDAPNA